MGRFRDKLTEAQKKAGLAKFFQEPALGLCVIPTDNGSQTPVIFRIINGELICDPPGGKPDPGEAHERAMEREFGEEVGVKVRAGGELGSLPHPVKEGLERHFYEASYIKGTPSNRVPKEHEACMMTDVENAIALFGDRIPDAAKNYLREEAARLENIVSQDIPRLMVG